MALRCILLVSILAAVAVPAPAAAAVITVPGDQPTIQAAIDAAVNGDEIVVAAGTYNESLSTFGKAITLRSADGRAVTTIDGAGTGQPVVRCNVGEGPDTVIEGFTITGGNPSSLVWQGGGGLFLNGTSPSIVDCRITGNTARIGGGIYGDGGSPQFSGCQIDVNTSGRGAGAAFLGGATPTFDGCQVSNNLIPHPFDCFSGTGAPGCSNQLCAEAVCAIDSFCCLFGWDAACADLAGSECFAFSLGISGAGVDGDGISLVMRDCDIDGNEVNFANPTVGESGGPGGGMDIEDGVATLVRCRIRNNEANVGGGVCASQSTVRLVSCEVLDNTALGFSGIGAGSSALEVTGCLVSGNMALFGVGGGIGLSGGTGRITSTTIAGNLADNGAGSAMAEFNAESLRIDNTIIYDNIGTQQLLLDFNSPAVVRWSCLEEGLAGPGNFDDDPQFVAAFAGDYRLVASSPCIDAGHTGAVPPDVFDLDADGFVGERLPHDLDGSPRIAADRVDFDPGCGLGAVVDMGAYELPGSPLDDVPWADVNGDGLVNIDDLVAVVLAFGRCPHSCCFTDVDFDRAITIDDIVAVVLHWSP